MLEKSCCLELTTFLCSSFAIKTRVSAAILVGLLRLGRQGSSTSPTANKSHHLKQVLYPLQLSRNEQGLSQLPLVIWLSQFRFCSSIQQPGLACVFLGAEKFSVCASSPRLRTLFRVGQRLVPPFPGLMFPSRVRSTFYSFWSP